MTTSSQDKYSLALDLSRTEGNLYKVKSLLEEARDEGDLRATYAISTWYLNGNKIIEVDEDKGVGLLLGISSCNIAEANFDLGFAYDTGRVVEQDDMRAFSYYMKAGLLGDSEACSQVSQFYREGKVVPFDENLAAAWEERSKQDEVDISPPYRIWLSDNL